MERHTRYLELRLAQCTSRPELHHHQIPVLRELLELARSGVSPAEYNRRAGNLFGLVRAEWLDRYDNLAALYRDLADDRMQQFAATARRAGEAQSFAEFSALMSRAMIESSPIELAAKTAAESLAPLVIALMHWATEADQSSQKVLAETCRGLWRAMQTSDPGCSWERVASYPPYRNRLPFDDVAIALIGSWLEEAVGTQLADLPPPQSVDPGPLPVIESPDAPELPSVADAARGYHLAYENAARGGPSSSLAVYERIFEAEAAASCVNDFMCRLLSADLICELSRAQYRDIASDALSHCDGLSQPLVEFHHRALGKALASSKSPTAIDYEIAKHEACFSVESAWHQILMSFLFRTITESMALEFDNSDIRRQTLKRSYAVTRTLFGDWDETFAIGRVWDFFRAVFFGFGRELSEEAPFDGIYRGEVGLELVTGFRALARMFVVELESAASPARFSSPEEMREHITGLFQAAMAGEKLQEIDPTAPDRGVILWGQAVSFEALLGAMSSPPRPC